MKKATSMALVAGITLALGGLTAPAAMADVNVVVQKGGPFISEKGPGDLAYNNVEHSFGVKTDQLDKSVEAGDLYNKAYGKHNSNTIEVEGAEQDQGEKS